ncbi:MAG: hypothetical protein ACK5FS_10595, partial [Planctomycetota bacterium]
MSLKYDPESIQLPEGWRKLTPILVALGVILVAVGFAFSLFAGGSSENASEAMMKFFAHSYLANFMFVMSIALGALFFILVQFVARAGWSTSVRRIAELLMQTIPFLAVVFAPIIIMLFANMDSLYEWNRPDRVHSSVIKAKIDVGYLTKEWFTLRT